MKKRLRTVTAILLSTFLAYFSTVPSFALTELKKITVLLNNKEINLNQPLTIEDGTVLVPFRNILEETGASVFWDSDTKTITCTKEDKTIRLTIGSSEIDINGEKYPLYIPVRITDNTALVPLRAISDALNANVYYDSETETIMIYTVEPIGTEDPATDETSDIKSRFDITDENETTLITAEIYSNSDLLKEKLSEKAYALFELNKISSAEKFLNMSIQKMNTSVEDLKKEAKTLLSQNTKYVFHPYEFTLTYDADEFDGFISIISTETTYTGGAHPATFKSAKTYGTETGAVALSDVSEALFGKDAEEILKEAKTLFLEKIKENPDKFYDDSENLLDYLSTENFYIDKNGLSFFFNQYEIAPYASGIIEVKIPFEQ